MAHPDVREVAVIGVTDPKWGEVGCAVIASISGDSVSLEAVHSQCEGNLARFKWPQQVSQIEALPRNSTGKVQKFVLRQQYA
jgi:fatty-acyl-CoA synthase